MEPQDIFELIIRADEAVKYATEDKAAARAAQARSLLIRARDEARAIGNQSLVDQAERRLADLDALASNTGSLGETREEDGPAGG